MKKFKITVECIEDGKTDVCVQQEFDQSEIHIDQQRFLDPRYVAGKMEPVGFWDKGHSLSISATHNQPPIPI